MKREEIKDRLNESRWEFRMSKTATPRQRAFIKSAGFNLMLVSIQEYLYDVWHGEIPSIGDEVTYAELLDAFTDRETAYQALDADNDPVGRAYVQALESLAIEIGYW